MTSGGPHMNGDRILAIINLIALLVVAYFLSQKIAHIKIPEFPIDSSGGIVLPGPAPELLPTSPPNPGED